VGVANFLRACLRGQCRERERQHFKEHNISHWQPNSAIDTFAMRRCAFPRKGPASRSDAGLLIVLQACTRSGWRSASAKLTTNVFRSILPTPLRGIFPNTCNRSGTL
jgi:hypothetical protein